MNRLRSVVAVAILRLAPGFYFPRLHNVCLSQSRRWSHDLVADDLTLQELESRFSDVLKHFASTNDASPFTEIYTPQMALLRGRLADLHLSRCQVLPSTIKGAGNGLFATRDLSSGELITLYPGDAILIRTGELEEVTGVLYGTPEHDPSLLTDAARAYEIRISSTHSVVGNKNNLSDRAYLGHIANDGVMLTNGSDAARTVYSKASAEAANASHEKLLGGCHLGLFATRDIASGCEIFVSYSEGYWLSRGDNVMYEQAQQGDRIRAKRKKDDDNKAKDGKKKTTGSGFK